MPDYYLREYEDFDLIKTVNSYVDNLISVINSEYDCNTNIQCSFFEEDLKDYENKIIDLFSPYY